MTKRAVVGINDYTGIDATGSSNLGLLCLRCKKYR